MLLLKEFELLLVRSETPSTQSVRLSGILLKCGTRGSQSESLVLGGGGSDHKKLKGSTASYELLRYKSTASEDCCL